MLSPYLFLGEIVKPQGIRGEVKVRHYTDDPGRFQELDSLLVKNGEAYQPLAIVGCRVDQDDVYLKLKGVSDRNEAEKLRGVRLYIDRQAKQPKRLIDIDISVGKGIRADMRGFCIQYESGFFFGRNQ